MKIGQQKLANSPVEQVLAAIAEEKNDRRIKCPVCSSELSRKWQTSSVGIKPSVGQPRWACSVCGGTFIRAELHPNTNRNAISASSYWEALPEVESCIIG